MKHQRALTMNHQHGQVLGITYKLTLHHNAKLKVSL